MFGIYIYKIDLQFLLEFSTNCILQIYDLLVVTFNSENYFISFFVQGGKTVKRK